MLTTLFCDATDRSSNIASSSVRCSTTATLPCDNIGPWHNEQHQLNITSYYPHFEVVLKKTRQLYHRLEILIIFPSFFNTPLEGSNRIGSGEGQHATLLRPPNDDTTNEHPKNMMFSARKGALCAWPIQVHETLSE